MEKAKKRVRPGNVVLLAITIILAFLFIYPVLFALLSAFKSNGDILKNPVAPPTSFYIQNFKDLFAHSDFAAAILHSVFLTVVSEILIVCIVPMAAYGIERRKSRFTVFTYTFFLSGMMIPFHLYMFPLFKEMKMFHMFGNMVGPVVCYISGSIAFGCLLYSSFLKGIPLEIEEAAMIDGCNPIQTFFLIVLPILKPTMVSVGILEAMWVWNDYLLPTLVLDIKSYKTIPMLIQYFRGSYGKVEMGPMMASIMLTVIPIVIVYLVGQKHIIKGVAAGAVKG